MKKTYNAPQIADVNLDPLMQTLDVVNGSNPQIESADAPSRGGEFYPL